jgi:hypothetical protein
MAFFARMSIISRNSEIFDYTIKIYFKNNPIICDQTITIGSNGIDFLHSNVDTLMKGHDVEMLLLEPMKDITDRFKHLSAYRKNDARAQGKCLKRNETLDDSDGSSAGILMILEAANTAEPLDGNR